MKRRIFFLLSAAALAVIMLRASPDGDVVTGRGTGDGYGGKDSITVSVTLRDGVISNVTAEGPKETQGIGSVAIERMPEAMVRGNTINVDGVSGATFSSNGILKAAEAALTAAGVNPDKYKTASVSREAVDETYNADIAIIGAGGAGMVAAIVAADAGKSVILVEKQAMAGGNSVRATGGMNAAHTPEQGKNKFSEEAGVEKTLAAAAKNWADNQVITSLANTVKEQWAEWQKNPEGYFDSMELMELDTLIGGHGINDPALVEALCSNTAPAVEWLKTVDIDLKSVGAAGGASVKRIHRPLNDEGRVASVGAYMIPRLEAACKARKNITMMMETTAKSILTDNSGAVSGIMAEGRSGNKITIHSKAVILASGGFGANLEMIAKLKPELAGFMTTNAPGIMGEGIVMGQELGAAVVDMDQIQIHPTVQFDSSSLITEGLRGDGAILVNKEGKRFFDEVRTRDVVSAAEIAQPGSFAWLVIDQKMVDESSVIKGYIARGYTFQGDTYEALAKAIDIPAEAFVKTMNDWNSYVANRNDPEFGRTSFIAPLDKAPFYAIKVTPGIHHTMGGLKIDAQTHVLKEDGSVIPGLFAAGEVTGGVHGGNRLGGTAVADFVVFGRIAGQSASDYIPVKKPLTPGTYEGKGKGYSEETDVTVKVTVDENAITGVEIQGDGEQPFGVPQFETYARALTGRTDGNIDAVSGATMTRDGIRDAVEMALSSARGEKTGASAVPMTFTAGEYTASAMGYNGPLTVKAVFDRDSLKAINIVSSRETPHVGDVAFDIMIPEMLQANGSGVDAVSGATFSTRALRNAVNAAAEQAACTNMDAFKAARVEHAPQEAIETTHDVVIVGGGGAGIAAAAQAAQDGNTVLIIEKNAEVGGNTLVSGGQYQSVMPYLVWDPKDPDAATGVYAFTGAVYDKVKSVPGCIKELQMILGWNEAPFDADYYNDHEYVAGDAAELSKHGVHAEYLPTLQALKTEIKAYLGWAQPKLDAGIPESQLTLFSTLNLHIFQTYYGGLRQSADKSQWIYGDVNLVRQFIEGGQGLKEWLEAMGSTFREDAQPTLIGALWYRENEFIGANVDTDGDGTPESYPGRWGTYFVAPIHALLKADKANRIMLRTTAGELIWDGGRVTGVKATRHDGTKVTAHAKKGVILATGGYAANLQEVVDKNIYWSPKYLSTATKTTNRSSLRGDGIAMAQAVGAGTTGMGFTQLMPISWVDNGNLAFGGGNYACWINPSTGRRFVDEGSERDVLSLAEFRNGMEFKGSKGVFLEFYNADEKIPGPIQLAEGDYPGRYYRRTIAQLPELFKELGVTADPKVVVETIRAYDRAVMTGSDFPDVGKAIASRCVGNVGKNEDGTYKTDSYDLEGTLLTIRLLAPSTHHTMGGVLVDTGRHVLTPDGKIISGLYAAGEVTGGIHGGNRLGGNAITEIYVSGRTAAQSVNADN